METNELSIQEIRIFAAIKKASGWVTNHQIAEQTGIPARTVRFKTKKFSDLGLCDVAELFPGHRYRWSEKASSRNSAYLRRLIDAEKIFGLTEGE